MILAAGRGERMRPLTDTVPKPLLQAGGRALIEYHVLNLVSAGITELVINVSYRGDQIEAHLGDGSRFGASIVYSREQVALETAGGLIQALPLLGSDPFLLDPFVLVNGDIWTDYPLASLVQRGLANNDMAHLVMVDNPDQHRGGDFTLDLNQRLRLAVSGTDHTVTYAGIALMHPLLLQGMSPGKLALRPVFDAAIGEDRFSAEYYAGQWYDIGTPQRLQSLDARLRGL